MIHEVYDCSLSSVATLEIINAFCSINNFLRLVQSDLIAGLQAQAGIHGRVAVVQRFREAPLEKRTIQEVYYHYLTISASQGMIAKQ